MFLNIIFLCYLSFYIQYSVSSYVCDKACKKWLENCDEIALKCLPVDATCRFHYECPFGSSCDTSATSDKYGSCQCQTNLTQEARCEHGNCPSGFHCNKCDVCINKFGHAPNKVSSLTPTSLVILVTSLIGLKLMFGL
ncbi:hypothetical protein Ddc_21877 [Ditylenchus destructor]|nr:hypothetical protein Ddc_21877 [Ditylenchus destructor]